MNDSLVQSFEMQWKSSVKFHNIYINLLNFSQNRLDFLTSIPYKPFLLLSKSF